MFFENDNLTFHLLGVFRLDQKNINILNRNRNFSAISYRLHADTVMETKDHKYHLTDHYIAFVPARVDYRRIAVRDEMIIINLEMQNYKADTIEFFQTVKPDIFEDLFTKILSCWEKKDAGYLYRCSAILNEILFECYVQNFTSVQQHSRIQNSVDYIERHFAGPMPSMQKIAALSYMSDVYFRKLFKEEYGISPKKYMIRLRIQYAASLISMGEHTLTEAAIQSGYADYKHFSVEFKRIMGVSPSAYQYNCPHIGPQALQQS